MISNKFVDVISLSHPIIADNAECSLPPRHAGCDHDIPPNTCPHSLDRHICANPLFDFSIFTTMGHQYTVDTLLTTLQGTLQREYANHGITVKNFFHSTINENFPPHKQDNKAGYTHLVTNFHSKIIPPLYCLISLYKLSQPHPSEHASSLANSLFSKFHNEAIYLTFRDFLSFFVPNWATNLYHQHYQTLFYINMLKFCAKFILQAQQQRRIDAQSRHDRSKSVDITLLFKSFISEYIRPFFHHLSPHHQHAILSIFPSCISTPISHDITPSRFHLNGYAPMIPRHFKRPLILLPFMGTINRQRTQSTSPLSSDDLSEISLYHHLQAHFNMIHIKDDSAFPINTELIMKNVTELDLCTALSTVNSLYTDDSLSSHTTRPSPSALLREHLIPPTTSILVTTPPIFHSLLSHNVLHSSLDIGDIYILSHISPHTEKITPSQSLLISPTTATNIPPCLPSTSYHDKITPSPKWKGFLDMISSLTLQFHFNLQVIKSFFRRFFHYYALLQYYTSPQSSDRWTTCIPQRVLLHTILEQQLTLMANQYRQKDPQNAIMPSSQSQLFQFIDFDDPTRTTNLPRYTQPYELTWLLYTFIYHHLYNPTVLTSPINPTTEISLLHTILTTHRMISQFSDGVSCPLTLHTHFPSPSSNLFDYVVSITSSVYLSVHPDPSPPSLLTLLSFTLPTLEIIHPIQRYEVLRQVQSSQILLSQAQDPSNSFPKSHSSIDTLVYYLEDYLLAINQLISPQISLDTVLSSILGVDRIKFMQKTTDPNHTAIITKCNRIISRVPSHIPLLSDQIFPQIAQDGSFFVQLIDDMYDHISSKSFSAPQPISCSLHTRLAKIYHYLTSNNILSTSKQSNDKQIVTIANNDFFMTFVRSQYSHKLTLYAHTTGNADEFPSFLPSPAFTNSFLTSTISSVDPGGDSLQCLRHTLNNIMLKGLDANITEEITSQLVSFPLINTSDPSAIVLIHNPFYINHILPDHDSSINHLLDVLQHTPKQHSVSLNLGQFITFYKTIEPQNNIFSHIFHSNLQIPPNYLSSSLHHSKLLQLLTLLSSQSALRMTETSPSYPSIAFEYYKYIIITIYYNILSLKHHVDYLIHHFAPYVILHVLQLDSTRFNNASLSEAKTLLKSGLYPTIFKPITRQLVQTLYDGMTPYILQAHNPINRCKYAIYCQKNNSSPLNFTDFCDKILYSSFKKDIFDLSLDIFAHFEPSLKENHDNSSLPPYFLSAFTLLFSSKLFEIIEIVNEYHNRATFYSNSPLYTFPPPFYEDLSPIDTLLDSIITTDANIFDFIPNLHPFLTGNNPVQVMEYVKVFYPQLLVVPDDIAPSINDIKKYYILTRSHMKNNYYNAKCAYITQLPHNYANIGTKNEDNETMDDAHTCDDYPPNLVFLHTLAKMTIYNPQIITEIITAFSSHVHAKKSIPSSPLPPISLITPPKLKQNVIYCIDPCEALCVTYFLANYVCHIHHPISNHIACNYCILSILMKPSPFTGIKSFYNSNSHINGKNTKTNDNAQNRCLVSPQTPIKQEPFQDTVKRGQNIVKQEPNLVNVIKDTSDSEESPRNDTFLHQNPSNHLDRNHQDAQNLPNSRLKGISLQHNVHTSMFHSERAAGLVRQRQGELFHHKRFLESHNAGQLRDKFIMLCDSLSITDVKASILPPQQGTSAYFTYKGEKIDKGLIRRYERIYEGERTEGTIVANNGSTDDYYRNKYRAERNDCSFPQSLPQITAQLPQTEEENFVECFDLSLISKLLECEYSGDKRDNTRFLSDFIDPRDCSSEFFAINTEKQNGPLTLYYDSIMTHATAETPFHDIFITNYSDGLTPLQAMSILYNYTIGDTTSLIVPLHLMDFINEFLYKHIKRLECFILQFTPEVNYNKDLHNLIDIVLYNDQMFLQSDYFHSYYKLMCFHNIYWTSKLPGLSQCSDNPQQPQHTTQIYHLSSISSNFNDEYEFATLIYPFDSNEDIQRFLNASTHSRCLYYMQIYYINFFNTILPTLTGFHTLVHSPFYANKLAFDTSPRICDKLNLTSSISTVSLHDIISDLRPQLDPCLAPLYVPILAKYGHSTQFNYDLTYKSSKTSTSHHQKPSIRNNYREIIENADIVGVSPSVTRASDIITNFSEFTHKYALFDEDEYSPDNYSYTNININNIPLIIQDNVEFMKTYKPLATCSNPNKTILFVEKQFEDRLKLVYLTQAAEQSLFPPVQPSLPSHLSLHSFSHSLMKNAPLDRKPQPTAAAKPRSGPRVHHNQQQSGQLGDQFHKICGDHNHECIDHLNKNKNRNRNRNCKNNNLYFRPNIHFHLQPTINNEPSNRFIRENGGDFIPLPTQHFNQYSGFNGNFDEYPPFVDYNQDISLNLANQQDESLARLDQQFNQRSSKQQIGDSDGNMNSQLQNQFHFNQEQLQSQVKGNQRFDQQKLQPFPHPADPSNFNNYQPSTARNMPSSQCPNKNTNHGNQPYPPPPILPDVVSPLKNHENQHYYEHPWSDESSSSSDNDDSEMTGLCTPDQSNIFLSDSTKNDSADQIYATIVYYNNSIMSSKTQVLENKCNMNLNQFHSNAHQFTNPTDNSRNFDASLTHSFTSNDPALRYMKFMHDLRACPHPSPLFYLYFPHTNTFYHPSRAIGIVADWHRHLLFTLLSFPGIIQDLSSKSYILSQIFKNLALISDKYREYQSNVEPIIKTVNSAGSLLRYVEDDEIINTVHSMYTYTIHKKRIFYQEFTHFVHLFDRYVFPPSSTAEQGVKFYLYFLIELYFFHSAHNPLIAKIFSRELTVADIPTHEDCAVKWFSHQYKGCDPDDGTKLKNNPTASPIMNICGGFVTWMALPALRLFGSPYLPTQPNPSFIQTVEGFNSPLLPQIAPPPPDPLTMIHPPDDIQVLKFQKTLQQQIANLPNTIKADIRGELIERKFPKPIDSLQYYSTMQRRINNEPLFTLWNEVPVEMNSLSYLIQSPILTQKKESKSIAALFAFKMLISHQLIRDDLKHYSRNELTLQSIPLNHTSPTLKKQNSLIIDYFIDNHDGNMYYLDFLNYGIDGIDIVPYTPPIGSVPVKQLCLTSNNSASIAEKTVEMREKVTKSSKIKTISSIDMRNGDKPVWTACIDDTKPYTDIYDETGQEHGNFDETGPSGLAEETPLDDKTAEIRLFETIDTIYNEFTTTYDENDDAKNPMTAMTDYMLDSTPNSNTTKKKSFLAHLFADHTNNSTCQFGPILSLSQLVSFLPICPTQNKHLFEYLNIIHLLAENESIIRWSKLPYYEQIVKLFTHSIMTYNLSHLYHFPTLFNHLMNVNRSNNSQMSASSTNNHKYGQGTSKTAKSRRNKKNKNQGALFNENLNTIINPQVSRPTHNTRNNNNNNNDKNITSIIPTAFCPGDKNTNFTPNQYHLWSTIPIMMIPSFFFNKQMLNAVNQCFPLEQYHDVLTHNLIFNSPPTQTNFIHYHTTIQNIDFSTCPSQYLINNFHQQMAQVSNHQDIYIPHFPLLLRYLSFHFVSNFELIKRNNITFNPLQTSLFSQHQTHSLNMNDFSFDFAQNTTVFSSNSQSTYDFAINEVQLSNFDFTKIQLLFPHKYGYSYNYMNQQKNAIYYIDGIPDIEQLYNSQLFPVKFIGANLYNPHLAFETLVQSNPNTSFSPLPLTHQYQLLYDTSIMRALHTSHIRFVSVMIIFLLKSQCGAFNSHIYNKMLSTKYYLSSYNVKLFNMTSILKYYLYYYSSTIYGITKVMRNPQLQYLTSHSSNPVIYTNDILYSIEHIGYMMLLLALQSMKDPHSNNHGQTHSSTLHNALMTSLLYKQIHLFLLTNRNIINFKLVELILPNLQHHPIHYNNHEARFKQPQHNILDYPASDELTYNNLPMVTLSQTLSNYISNSHFTKDRTDYLKQFLCNNYQFDCSEGNMHFCNDSLVLPPTLFNFFTLLASMLLLLPHTYIYSMVSLLDTGTDNSLSSTLSKSYVHVTTTEKRPYPIINPLHNPTYHPAPPELTVLFLRDIMNNPYNPSPITPSSAPPLNLPGDLSAMRNKGSTLLADYNTSVFKTKSPFAFTLPLSSVLLLNNIASPLLFKMIDTIGRHNYIKSSSNNNNCNQTLYNAMKQINKENSFHQSDFLLLLNNPTYWLSMAYNILVQVSIYNTKFIDYNRLKTFAEYKYLFSLKNNIVDQKLQVLTIQDIRSDPKIQQEIAESLLEYNLDQHAQLIYKNPENNYTLLNNEVKLSNNIILDLNKIEGVDFSLFYLPPQHHAIFNDIVIKQHHALTASTTATNLLDYTLPSLHSIHSHNLSASIPPQQPTLEQLFYVGHQLQQQCSSILNQKYLKDVKNSQNVRDEVSLNQMNDTADLNQTNDVNILHTVESLLRTMIDDLNYAQNILSPSWHHYYITVVTWPTEQQFVENAQKIFIAQHPHPDSDEPCNIFACPQAHNEHVNTGYYSSHASNESPSSGGNNDHFSIFHDNSSNSFNINHRPECVNFNDIQYHQINNIRVNYKHIRRTFSLTDYYQQLELQKLSYKHSKLPTKRVNTDIGMSEIVDDDDSAIEMNLDEFHAFVNTSNISIQATLNDPVIHTLSMCLSTPFALPAAMLVSPIKGTDTTDLILTPVYEYQFVQKQVLPQTKSISTQLPLYHGNIDEAPEMNPLDIDCIQIKASLYKTDLLQQNKELSRYIVNNNPYLLSFSSNSYKLSPKMSDISNNILIPNINLYQLSSTYTSRLISITGDRTANILASLFSAIDMGNNMEHNHTGSYMPEFYEKFINPDKHAEPLKFDELGRLCYHYNIHRYPYLTNSIQNYNAADPVIPYHYIMEQIHHIECAHQIADEDVHLLHKNNNNHSIDCNPYIATIAAEAIHNQADHIFSTTDAQYIDQSNFRTKHSKEDRSLSHYDPQTNIVSYLFLPLISTPTFADIIIATCAYEQHVQDYITAEQNICIRAHDEKLKQNGITKDDEFTPFDPLDSNELTSLAVGAIPSLGQPKPSVYTTTSLEGTITLPKTAQLLLDPTFVTLFPRLSVYFETHLLAVLKYHQNVSNTQHMYINDEGLLVNETIFTPISIPNTITPQIIDWFYIYASATAPHLAQTTLHDNMIQPNPRHLHRFKNINSRNIQSEHHIFNRYDMFSYQTPQMVQYGSKKCLMDVSSMFTFNPKSFISYRNTHASRLCPDYDVSLTTFSSDSQENSSLTSPQIFSLLDELFESFKDEFTPGFNPPSTNLSKPPSRASAAIATQPDHLVLYRNFDDIPSHSSINPILRSSMAHVDFSHMFNPSVPQKKSLSERDVRFKLIPEQSLLDAGGYSIHNFYPNNVFTTGTPHKIFCPYHYTGYTNNNLLVSSKVHKNINEFLLHYRKYENWVIKQETDPLSNVSKSEIEMSVPKRLETIPSLISTKHLYYQLKMRTIDFLKSQNIEFDYHTMLQYYPTCTHCLFSSVSPFPHHIGQCFSPYLNNYQISESKRDLLRQLMSRNQHMKSQAYTLLSRANHDDIAKYGINFANIQRHKANHNGIYVPDELLGMNHKYYNLDYFKNDNHSDYYDYSLVTPSPHRVQSKSYLFNSSLQLSLVPTPEEILTFCTNSLNLDHSLSAQDKALIIAILNTFTTPFANDYGPSESIFDKFYVPRTRRVNQDLANFVTNIVTYLAPDSHVMLDPTAGSGINILEMEYLPWINLPDMTQTYNTISTIPAPYNPHLSRVLNYWNKVPDAKTMHIYSVDHQSTQKCAPNLLKNILTKKLLPVHFELRDDDLCVSVKNFISGQQYDMSSRDFELELVSTSLSSFITNGLDSYGYDDIHFNNYSLTDSFLGQNIDNIKNHGNLAFENDYQFDAFILYLLHIEPSQANASLDTNSSLVLPSIYYKLNECNDTINLPQTTLISTQTEKLDQLMDNFDVYQRNTDSYVKLNKNGGKYDHIIPTTMINCTPASWLIGNSQIVSQPVIATRAVSPEKIGKNQRGECINNNEDQILNSMTQYIEKSQHTVASHKIPAATTNTTLYNLRGIDFFSMGSLLPNFFAVEHKLHLCELSERLSINLQHDKLYIKQQIKQSLQTKREYGDDGEEELEYISEPLWSYYHQNYKRVRDFTTHFRDLSYTKSIRSFSNSLKSAKSLASSSSSISTIANDDSEDLDLFNTFRTKVRNEVTLPVSASINALHSPSKESTPLHLLSPLDQKKAISKFIISRLHLSPASTNSTQKLMDNPFTDLVRPNHQPCIPISLFSLMTTTSNTLNNDDMYNNYEQLEVIGDAYLKLSMCLTLTNAPLLHSYTEGAFSILKDQLVSNNTLKLLSMGLNNAMKTSFYLITMITSILDKEFVDPTKMYKTENNDSFTKLPLFATHVPPKGDIPGIINDIVQPLHGSSNRVPINGSINVKDKLKLASNFFPHKLNNRLNNAHIAYNNYPFLIHSPIDSLSTYPLYLPTSRRRRALCIQASQYGTDTTNLFGYLAQPIVLTDYLISPQNPPQIVRLETRIRDYLDYIREAVPTTLFNQGVDRFQREYDRKTSQFNNIPDLVNNATSQDVFQDYPFSHEPRDSFKPPVEAFLWNNFHSHGLSAIHNTTVHGVFTLFSLTAIDIHNLYQSQRIKKSVRFISSSNSTSLSTVDLPFPLLYNRMINSASTKCNSFQSLIMRNTPLSNGTANAMVNSNNNYSNYDIADLNKTLQQVLSQKFEQFQTAFSTAISNQATDCSQINSHSPVPINSSSLSPYFMTVFRMKLDALSNTRFNDNFFKFKYFALSQKYPVPYQSSKFSHIPLSTLQTIILNTLHPTLGKTLFDMMNLSHLHFTASSNSTLSKTFPIKSLFNVIPTSYSSAILTFIKIPRARMVDTYDTSFNSIQKNIKKLYPYDRTLIPIMVNNHSNSTNIQIDFTKSGKVTLNDVITFFQPNGAEQNPINSTHDGLLSNNPQFANFITSLYGNQTPQYHELDDFNDGTGLSPIYSRRDFTNLGNFFMSSPIHTMWNPHELMELLSPQCSFYYHLPSQNKYISDIMEAFIGVGAMASHGRTFLSHLALDTIRFPYEYSFLPTNTSYYTNPEEITHDNMMSCSPDNVYNNQHSTNIALHLNNHYTIHDYGPVLEHCRHNDTDVTTQLATSIDSPNHNLIQAINQQQELHSIFLSDKNQFFFNTVITSPTTFTSNSAQSDNLVCSCFFNNSTDKYPCRCKCYDSISLKYDSCDSLLNNNPHQIPKDIVALIQKELKKLSPNSASQQALIYHQYIPLNTSAHYATVFTLLISQFRTLIRQSGERTNSMVLSPLQFNALLYKDIIKNDLITQYQKNQQQCNSLSNVISVKLSLPKQSFRLYNDISARYSSIFGLLQPLWVTNPAQMQRFPLLSHAQVDFSSSSNPFHSPQDLSNINRPIYNLSNPTTVPLILRNLCQFNDLQYTLYNHQYFEYISLSTLGELQTLMKYKFNHPVLLVIAITHPALRTKTSSDSIFNIMEQNISTKFNSFSAPNPTTLVTSLSSTDNNNFATALGTPYSSRLDYQVLEFLGDSLLDYIFLSFFLHHWSYITPNHLHYLKRVHVCRQSLSNVCLSHGIHHAILEQMYIYNFKLNYIPSLSNQDVNRIESLLKLSNDEIMDQFFSSSALDHNIPITNHFSTIITTTSEYIAKLHSRDVFNNLNNFTKNSEEESEYDECVGEKRNDEVSAPKKVNHMIQDDNKQEDISVLSKLGTTNPVLRRLQRNSGTIYDTDDDTITTTPTISEQIVTPAQIKNAQRQTRLQKGLVNFLHDIPISGSHKNKKHIIHLLSSIDYNDPKAILKTIYDCNKIISSATTDKLSPTYTMQILAYIISNIDNNTIFDEVAAALALKTENDSPKYLSDVIEALLGAVYLDSGYNLQTVWIVLNTLFYDDLRHILQSLLCTPPTL